MAESGQPIPGSLYVYAPNRGAPIFFAIAYLISAIFHVWQCFRYKAWKLIGLHPLCAWLFTAGYALREYGSYNYLYSSTTSSALIIFVLSQVFIYICPPLLELANYHVLGRVFSYVPHCAPLPPNRVRAIFGGLMALIEALNSVGVALAANPSASKGSQSLGKNLTIAAVALQVAAIITFVSMTTVFHARFTRAQLRSKSVTTMLFVLYTSMALILARCVFRLVEHTGNTKIDLGNMEVLRELSPLLRYEVYFYIFEATLMLANSWLWNIWHPGRYLPRGSHVFLAQDGTEVVGEKHDDSRPLLAKVMHVLTFGILFRDRTKRGHRMMDELSDYPPHGSHSA